MTNLDTEDHDQADDDPQEQLYDYWASNAYDRAGNR